MISTEKSKAISEAFSRVNIMAISLPNFPPFEVHLDGNAGPRWKKWLGRFERLTIGMGISDDTQKRALLLHYGGPEVDEIFDTLQDVGGDKDYKKAVEKLTAHFSPQVNITYEVYNFRQAKQKDGENLDCFHTRLRSLTKTVNAVKFKKRGISTHLKEKQRHQLCSRSIMYAPFKAARGLICFRNF